MKAMSSAKDDLYSRIETLRSMFSNHQEIHSFGYGFGGWILTNASPSLEPMAKAAVLGVLAVIYGYDGFCKYTGLEISREDIPVDIRRQKHYFLFGVVAAYLLERSWPFLVDAALYILSIVF